LNWLVFMLVAIPIMGGVGLIIFGKWRSARHIADMTELINLLIDRTKAAPNDCTFSTRFMPVNRLALAFSVQFYGMPEANIPLQIKLQLSRMSACYLRLIFRMFHWRDITESCAVVRWITEMHYGCSKCPSLLLDVVAQHSVKNFPRLILNRN
jgi:hypothetical protein